MTHRAVLDSKGRVITHDEKGKKLNKEIWQDLEDEEKALRVVEASGGQAQLTGGGYGFQGQPVTQEQQMDYMQGDFPVIGNQRVYTPQQIHYWDLYDLDPEEAEESVQWGDTPTTRGALVTQFYAYQPQELEMLQRVMAIKGLYKLDKDELGTPSEATYAAYKNAITRMIRKQRATEGTQMIPAGEAPVTQTQVTSTLTSPVLETGTPRVRRKGVAPIG